MNALVSQRNRIPLEDLPELRGENEDPEAGIEKAENERILQKGIRNLSARDRLFMKLHLEKGLSLEEVAGIMHLSMQNAYSVKHRAIKRLKSHMKT